MTFAFLHSFGGSANQYDLLKLNDSEFAMTSTSFYGIPYPKKGKKTGEGSGVQAILRSWEGAGVVKQEKRRLRREPWYPLQLLERRLQQGGDQSLLQNYKW